MGGIRRDAGKNKRQGGLWEENTIKEREAKTKMQRNDDTEPGYEDRRELKLLLSIVLTFLLAVLDYTIMDQRALAVRSSAEAEVDKQ